MNVPPAGVTNAANLLLFMVNVASRLRAEAQPRDPDYSVLDLKADCRGAKDVEETLKLLPEKTRAHFIDQDSPPGRQLGAYSSLATLLQPFVIGEGIGINKIFMPGLTRLLT